MIISLFTDATIALISLVYIQIVANALFLTKGNSKYISFGLIFFVLISLFNYGSFLTLGKEAFINYDNEIVFAALKLTFWVIGAFCIGYYIKRNVKEYDCSEMQINLSSSNLALIKKVSKILIIISIPFLFYIDFQRIGHTITEGYDGLYGIGANNPIIKYGSLLANLARPSLLLLMISYYYEPKKARQVLILFVCYSLFSMLSGARIIATVYILTFLLFYIKIYVRNLSAKNIILLGALTIFMVTFLPSISAYRGGGDVSSLSMESGSYYEEGGSVKAFASEFGDSFDCVLLSMMYIHKFNYGLTYIVSFLAISPKIPQFLWPITETNFSFVKALPEYAQAYLGGSCIAEAYYNFGIFMPLFFILVGMAVCKIDEGLTELSTKNIFSCILNIALVPCIIHWVRGMFLCLMQEGFWIPFLYRLFLKNKIEDK